jgi:hypothetical protein
MANDMKGRDPIRRIIKMRSVRSNSNHTYRRENLNEDASIFVGASRMCGCGYFLSFIF